METLTTSIYKRCCVCGASLGQHMGPLDFIRRPESCEACKRAKYQATLIAERLFVLQRTGTVQALSTDAASPSVADTAPKGSIDLARPPSQEE